MRIREGQPDPPRVDHPDAYLTTNAAEEPEPRDGILRRVIIDASREPRLQFGDAEPFAVDSCEVLRDIERSTLTNIMLGGAALPLPVGARVTLWAGPNVVFVGKAVDDYSVLDLLSTETDAELSDSETI